MRRHTKLALVLVVSFLAVLHFAPRLLHRGEDDDEDNVPAVLRYTSPASALAPYIPSFVFNDAEGSVRDIDQAQSPPRSPPPPPPPPPAKHKFRADGLVEVNLDAATHPIVELVSKAETEWAEKHRKASRTLEECVSEYRRRYGRAPPKGFDSWWRYVQEHNVLLPDEYDQIHHDLEPFWGIEPSDLLSIHAENEQAKDTYTIGKTTPEEPMSILTHAYADEKRWDTAGPERALELFRGLEKEGYEVPVVRMTFTPDDRPNRHTDFGIRDVLLQAAMANTYIDVASLPKTANLGWISACHPASPARQRPPNLDNPSLPHIYSSPSSSGLQGLPLKKTFIHNHLAAMDPCLHPNVLTHHGQFVSHERGPAPQRAMVPEFAQCSTVLHHNIRVPTLYGWVEDLDVRPIRPSTAVNPGPGGGPIPIPTAGGDLDWEEKYDERLLWRGSNTGIFHSRSSRWRQAHRTLLVEFGNELRGSVGVLVQQQRGKGAGLEVVEMKRARVNPAMMDVAFAGEPISCARDVCGVLKEGEGPYVWREKMSVREAGRYKYVLDVDGNGWSGRFKRLMTSNSVIFKATIYPEWYMDRIAPWLHYVPIQTDLSDLHDALVFFRGDASGNGAHEALARKIGTAGREWSLKYWRKEDMVAYMYRLTLEYARLMSLDRESMSFPG